MNLRATKHKLKPDTALGMRDKDLTTQAITQDGRAYFQILGKKQVDRFWSYVNKNGPLPDQSKPAYAGLDVCWIWTASTFRNGYGQLKCNGKNLKAHRISWQLGNGPITKHELVCHKCDNTGCVNPNHLTIGTHLSNIRDMIWKGRKRNADSKMQSEILKRRAARGSNNGANTRPDRRPTGDRHGSKTKPEKIVKGESQPFSKLTEQTVRDMRFLKGKGLTLKALSAMFEVSRQTAGKAINRITWKHVK